MVIGIKKANIIVVALAVLSMILLDSCGKSNGPSYGRRTAGNPGKVSASTGAELNFDITDTTKFTVVKLKDQVVGPKLKYIQGGRAVIGTQEQDVMGFRDNTERYHRFLLHG